MTTTGPPLAGGTAPGPCFLETNPLLPLLHVHDSRDMGGLCRGREEVTGECELGRQEALALWVGAGSRVAVRRYLLLLLDITPAGCYAPLTCKELRRGYQMESRDITHNGECSLVHEKKDGERKKKGSKTSCRVNNGPGER